MGLLVGEVLTDSGNSEVFAVSPGSIELVSLVYVEVVQAVQVVQQEQPWQEPGWYPYSAAGLPGPTVSPGLEPVGQEVEEAEEGCLPSSVELQELERGHPRRSPP